MVAQCSFLKIFSLFLRPSGALALLLPLDLSYLLPRILFQSHFLDHCRSPGLNFLFLFTGNSLPGVALSSPAVSTVTLSPEIWGSQCYAPRNRIKPRVSQVSSDRRTSCWEGAAGHAVPVWVFFSVEFLLPLLWGTSEGPGFLVNLCPNGERILFPWFS